MTEMYQPALPETRSGQPNRFIVVMVGFVAMCLPAGCSSEANPRPDRVRTLPVCAGAPLTPERFDEPGPKRLVFDEATGRFEGQPQVTAADHEHALKGLVGVVNYGLRVRGSSTGVVVLTPSGQVVIVTAAHSTEAEPDLLAELNAAPHASTVIPGHGYVKDGCTLSPEPGVGPDLAAVSVMGSLDEREPYEWEPYAGCPDGLWAMLANLQGGRAETDPAVYPAYMTRINDGTGRCVAITGLPGEESVEPGASGGAVLYNGMLIAISVAAVNPGGSTQGVEMWTADQVEKYTGLKLVGGPDRGYAVAEVVTSGDLAVAVSAADAGFQGD